MMMIAFLINGQTLKILTRPIQGQKLVFSSPFKLFFSVLQFHPITLKLFESFHYLWRMLIFFPSMFSYFHDVKEFLYQLTTKLIFRHISCDSEPVSNYGLIRFAP